MKLLPIITKLPLLKRFVPSLIRRIFLSLLHGCRAGDKKDGQVAGNTVRIIEDGDEGDSGEGGDET